MSEVAFNDGKPLTNVGLQRVKYREIKKILPSAQMACSVTRHVAAAYKAAVSNKRPVTKPFAFSRSCALWLIGSTGRDARVCDDGTLSIWTVNGRKRVPFIVPKRLRADFDAAIEFNALQACERKGVLVVTLCLTLPDVPTAGTSAVGVDLNETNALVAVDAQDRTLFVSGKEQRVRNRRTHKTRNRLQKKLATLKAQKRSTKSVGRVLKRLGRKRYNRTRDFARCSAKLLCDWAPKDALIALEDLKIPQATKKRIPGKSPARKKLRLRFSSFAYRIFRTAIESRAERIGIAVVAVNPKFTSQDCSRCKKRGDRKRHRFSCEACGHADHADVNAARNIRDLAAPKGAVGCPSTSPEASLRGKLRSSESLTSARI